MIDAYPLTWPQGFARSKSRQDGAFKTSLPSALKNVEHSLALFARDSRKKLEGVVIDSNVSLGQQRPADPGVAVWFVWDELQVAIPVDRYTKVEYNLQAIHHIIEARRTELRHGGLAIVRATFTGFKCLPAPDWRPALGFAPGSAPSLAAIEANYKRLRSETHPDRPNGTADAFNQVQVAYEQAKGEVQG